MELFIMRRTGININNLPPDIFANINDYRFTNSGDLVLSLCNTSSNSSIMSLINLYDNTLRLAGQTNSVSVQNINGQQVMDVFQQSVVTTNQQPALEVIAITPNVVIAPTPVFQAQQQQIAQILAERDEEDNDNDDDQSNENVMKPTRYIPCVECDAGKDKILIARSMRNGLSSSTSVINEKVNSLNALMARTIILQNEINVLMEPLENNKKVLFVLEKINELNQSVRADSVIKKAYINTDGNISILTNRVHTERLEDETVRDIGELEIVISSVAVLSETATTVENPIKIKNLTHYLSNDNGAWTCGHARYEGDICFGNVYPQIHRALLDKNFLMVVEILIRFIRNPDIHDAWGKNILGFPIVGSDN